MTVKAFDTIQNEADQLIRVWDANPNFSLDGVTLPMFQSLVDSFKNTRAAAENLRTLLTRSVSDTNEKAAAVAQITIRGRGGIRAYFGADSVQYEQVGGTRISQHRSRRPKSTQQTTETA